MKIIEATFFETFPIPASERWQKIVLKAALDEGDDVRQSLYKLKKEVENFFYESNKAAEKENALLPVIKINDQVAADKNNAEWEEIKLKLSKIKYKEEAHEYLNTTKYSMLVEAKQIINLKKSKHEKK